MFLKTSKLNRSKDKFGNTQTLIQVTELRNLRAKLACH